MPTTKGTVLLWQEYRSLWFGSVKCTKPTDIRNKLRPAAGPSPYRSRETRRSEYGIDWLHSANDFFFFLYLYFRSILIYYSADCALKRTSDSVGGSSCSWVFRFGSPYAVGRCFWLCICKIRNSAGLHYYIVGWFVKFISENVADRLIQYFYKRYLCVLSIII